jgi:hypothetical protein
MEYRMRPAHGAYRRVLDTGVPQYARTAVSQAPAHRSISEVLTLPTLLGLWVWMIWTGVVLWRHTPKMSVA